MSRAARVLKWTVAVTVLLAAAPIAYAEPVPSSTRLHAQDDSARCGGEPADFAGLYTVADSTDQQYAFDAGTMTVRLSYFGTPAATGTWQAGGGEIQWTVGGVTYDARPAGVVCADPAAASRQRNQPPRSITATSTDGSDTLVLNRG